MDYHSLRKEMEYYVRKISILEDWFRFVITKGYLQEGDGMRVRLNEKRPAEVPTMTALRGWSKEQMVEAAGPLSLHAETLDTIRHEVFRKNKCPGFLRLGVANVMMKLETDEIQNWTSPFTCGMSKLDHVFGSKLKFLNET